MEKVTEFLKPLEVKHDREQFAAEGTTRWGNKDIYPVIQEHRTYSARSFWVFWASGGVCVTSWTLGSSMIGIGLNVPEAFGAVLCGVGLSSILGHFCGQSGRVHHVGFMMLNRASFGLWGSYFSIMLCVFESIIFFGIQSYYGGQAVVVVLNAIFPQFMNMANTLPDSAAITTQALLGFLIYHVFYIPALWVPVHHIYKFLYPNTAVIFITFFGILGYFIHANGGTGDLIQPTIKLTRVERAFGIIASINSVAGAYTGGTVRAADWTRYAKYRRAPVIPLLISFSGTVTFGALIGILVTSASNHLYGEVIWSPLLLLQHLQKVHYTPACRAGTFFAGLGLLCSQVFVNLCKNGIAQGMDIAAFAPRYFDIRRGAILTLIIGILIQPWRYLSQAKMFLTVLNSFGVFIAPQTGILVVDFWIVRRQRLKIPDLYKQGGIYWYIAGINWRAAVAFIGSFVWSMPGFVCTLSGDDIAKGWIRIYQLTYFVGLLSAGLIYYLCCKISPPDGKDIMETMGEAVIEGLVAGREGASATESDVEEQKVEIEQKV
ncbi:NCS1 family nucleobase:cation symporter-1 [Xylariomycetidae sp. FL2044]|nr:NCS1 family nucleobase:cation symporter-1 [Xylariomycetidae sp. FL2044]